MRMITVKGTGNVSVRPDYIILSLNIETLSKTYDRAMSEAAERIERLQGAAVCFADMGDLVELILRDRLRVFATDGFEIFHAFSHADNHLDFDVRYR